MNHPMRRIFYIVLTACTLTACTSGSSSASKGDASVPDTIPYFANSLYYCNDSLLFYARRAYLEDDMDALRKFKSKFGLLGVCNIN